MSFCVNCGKELTEGQLFCPQCGTRAADSAPKSEPVVNPVPPAEEKAGINAGMLVWSIINIFLSTVLGIIALVFTILASNEPIERAQKTLKTAKILNIVATVLGVIGVILSIILVIFVIIIGVADPYYYYDYYDAYSTAMSLFM